jgi:S1-C subfamily serine protease
MNRRWLLAVVPILCGIALLVPPSLFADEKADVLSERARVIDKIRSTIVMIRATPDKENDSRIRPGLGVLIDPQGTVIVPRRRVEGAGKIEVTLHDGRTLPAKSLGVDCGAEIAVLKLESDRPFSHAEFGDSAGLKLGDWVVSFDLFGRDPTPEFGLLSGRRQDKEGNESLRIDSAISCPLDRDLLFSMDGKVLGIWTKTGAVPSSRVQEAVGRLLKKK